MKIDNRTRVFVVLYQHVGASAMSKLGGVFDTMDKALEKIERIHASAIRFEVDIEATMFRTKINAKRVIQ